MKIALTGGSGKLGHVVLDHLRSVGHDVWNLDRVGAREPGFIQTDLTDYGQVIDALAGVDDRYDGIDAVVHLGAIPAPGLAPDSATFRNNMLSTYSIFEATRKLGINRIVYASSETVLGLPFDIDPPYIPVDEEYEPRPESTYSLVKYLEEQMARQLCRWNPELSVSAFRFSNVMLPEDYAQFPSYDADPRGRKWNLWGYIDARDGGQAVEKALEAARPGFEAYIIAAADTVMSRSSASLAAEVFPNVRITKELGEHETMLGIDKARRLLGFDPQYGWRQEA
ncbi:NAD-dependent epimerase/dehydratase family protein [Sinomonas humi]|uniref:UDP-glucose 4-epimerase n=1 Tax=Sinomonas humi TaxID=1338436 RepID=A0A0B2AN26_9MICC|nr:NAD(P)-dependent oxidoreductase [Sinomonas humi]KHL03170.1 UDP-glucose 4-epimerase [Sinomonas humi]